VISVGGEWIEDVCGRRYNIRSVYAGARRVSSVELPWTYLNELRVRSLIRCGRGTHGGKSMGCSWNPENDWPLAMSEMSCNQHTCGGCSQVAPT
jgi:hypothetical protein